MKRPCGCGCLGLTLAAVLFAALLYLFRAWVLPLPAEYLLQSDPLKKSDVIVVLSGNAVVRAPEAAALYREGWSPRVLVTRDQPEEGFYELRKKGILLPENIDMAQQILEGLGVPRASIWRMEASSDNTLQEARYAGEFLKKQHVSRVILVTSKLHSRRTCLVFHQLFEKDFQICCRYSRFDSFEPHSWWKARKATREFLIELQKTIAYKLQFAWGNY